jgi:HlyD family secretion protein
MFIGRASFGQQSMEQRVGLEMNESPPTTTTQREPPQAKKQQVDARPRPARAPSIILGVMVLAIAGLSIWYLVRPQPLLVQGEVDATRLDIAARVDGRVGEIPVVRGQDVAASAALSFTSLWNEHMPEASTRPCCA